MRYSYPQVSGGYRWNLFRRCLNEVGVEPVSVGDTAGQTVVGFPRELTAEEKSKLDILMADNPTLPPAPKGTVFKIKDIWEFRADFSTSTGLPAEIYYSDSGSGKIDMIELHFSSNLNNAQKNKIRTAYSNLISEG